MAHLRTYLGWCVLAMLAVAAAGCGTVSAQGTGPAASRSSGRPAPSPAQPGTPIWLDTLQMTSATTGWALRWAGDPSGAAPVYLAPSRTTNGGRTWADVTPLAARPLLDTQSAAAVLDPLSGERAYLAVTAATADSNAVKVTEVFATSNGGRAWAESAPLQAADWVSLLTFADARHGWLLFNTGGAMGQDPVQLYRTIDAGLRWSLIAATPQAGTGSNGLPVSCGKTGLTFATTAVGWLDGSCFSLSDALLVSRDGGATWAPQPLPLPASYCRFYGCFVYGPQFAGGTGFLTVDRANGTPYLLVSHDLGATWQHVPLPSGSRTYPQLTFFGPPQGVLVPEASQEAIGPVFYTTADGGLTWTAVPQGQAFTQLGAAIDFVSTQTGFAWTLGTDATSGAPAMYETASSGRSWTEFTPRLAASG
jgi:photosystem II stability/assembly factor-like uncharacterized protein